MKHLILILSIIYLFSCSQKGQNNKLTSKDNIKQAETALTELENALKKDDGQLWNHKLNGPILLINRDNRTVIANEQNEQGTFAKQGDLYIGKFPGNMNIANTAVDWNNKRWTMVALPLPKTKESRLNLLIHESFHAIQPLIGFDSINTIQSIHLDSEAGRVYLKLELEALKKALDSDNPEIHIKNALLIRQYRYQLFPEAKKAENSLELLEGLAEFTGSTLCGKTNDELQNHYISQINWFYTMPTYVRSFAYFTIPVYGYFMRQKDKEWNLKINKKTNLTDFIVHFYKVNDSNLTQMQIEATGKLYKIDSILTIENKREQLRITKINKFKAKFLSEHVFSIDLEKMSIGFNPQNLVPLDTLGTVYPNLRITDIWGVLEVDSCGALLSMDYKKVTITYPEQITDTLITGKGWKLKLNKSWKPNKNKGRYSLIKK